ncbi:MAG: hypothetical protein ACHQ4G_13005, partial [Opitutales bacterium]
LKERLAEYNKAQVDKEKAAKDKADKDKADKAKAGKGPADAKAAPAPAAPVAPGPATVMPEFTVSASRVSELDIEIQKLEKQIEREKKHLKSTKLDDALNGDQTPKVLSIFGGKTTAQRESVAADRVTFLEGERDILEALKHVRTKQDSDQLQAQLDALKTMSRDLDETLR